MDGWVDGWSNDWLVGGLWDVTGRLYKGDCCVMITAQEGLPQQLLGQETALRDIEKDLNEKARVIIFSFETVTLFCTFCSL